MFVEQGYYFYNHLNSLGSLQMTQSHLGQEWSFLCCYPTNTGFPGGFSGKELACQCRRWTRPEFDSWDRRSPGGRPGNPLQYIFLENPMDRGAWRTTVHRVTKSWTRLKQLSTQACRVLLFKIETFHDGDDRALKQGWGPPWACGPENLHRAHTN